MKSEIKNRIIKQGFVDWRKCVWLQPENLKNQTKEQLEKLKNSILKNGFAMPFFVWEHNGKNYILDGHHRQPALEALSGEGLKTPEKLPALWIDAKNEKEAKKFILIYNTSYAKFNKDKVYEFIEEFDPVELSSEIEIPEIDIGVDFGKGNIEFQTKKKELPDYLWVFLGVPMKKLGAVSTQINELKNIEGVIYSERTKNGQ